MYELNDERLARELQTSLTKICPQCLQRKEVVLHTRDPLAYKAWKNGALVQVAFPNATPAEREQLLTGLCSDECWDKYTGVG